MLIYNDFCKNSKKFKIWHFHFEYGTLFVDFQCSQILMKLSSIAS